MNAKLRDEQDSPGLKAANAAADSLTVLAEIAERVENQNIARSSLGRVRDELDAAVNRSTRLMAVLRGTIVHIRPTGLLTVDQMGEAIGRDRNYVDSIWSDFGDTQRDEDGRVRQTRVYADATDADRADATVRLSGAAKAQRNAAADEKTAREERDRVVALVYASRILGPSAIAAAVGVDRNHVLRIARKRGVQPMHRDGSRNQYSK